MSGIKAVQNYISSKDRIMEYFKCDGDFFVKPLIDYQWRVTEDGDFYILTYWNADEKSDAVVIKKDGRPMIYEAEQYSMVVGINCVRIGFIFLNDKKNN